MQAILEYAKGNKKYWGFQNNEINAIIPMISWYRSLEGQLITLIIYIGNIVTLKTNTFLQNPFCRFLSSTGPQFENPCLICLCFCHILFKVHFEKLCLSWK